VIRPEVQTKEGAQFCRLNGVPTGSPISTFLFNLYLVPLDEKLNQVEGGFYVRYGDDLVFAHPNLEVTKKVDLEIDQTLASLGLSANPEKRLNVFFNGAGRVESGWSGSKGASRLDFLGWSLRFNGEVGMGPKKVTQFRIDLKKRVQSTASRFRNLPSEERGRLVCQVVNETLFSLSPFSNVNAPVLRRAVNDRAQLTELDRWVAETIISTLTQIRSPIMYRRLSYRHLRKEWGLGSLVRQRNKGSRN
jgi:hypothetical protein